MKRDKEHRFGIVGPNPKGLYLTDESFYKNSGGVLAPSAHYEAMFKAEVG